jgi:hypothetical protein
MAGGAAGFAARAPKKGDGDRDFGETIELSGKDF